MNRAERRANKIVNKDPTLTIKKSQLDQMIQDAEARGQEVACADAAQDIFVLLLSLPLKVLHENFGWGKKRLLRLSEGLLEEYARFAESEMSLSDYQDYVYEMTGIKFATQEED